MKNHINLMRILLLLLVISCIAGDCEDKKGIKSLNSVQIPEYSDSDYVKLLDNKNPEIVYNAICNLIAPAESYGQILSKDTIADSMEKNKAGLIYQKISQLLLSDNEWIVCSSLRFFTNFGSAYKNKDEIIQHLLKVNLKTKSIKLEFINALEGLKGANLKPIDKTLDAFLNNKSWLMSRFSYKIIPFTENYGFSEFLLAKYKTAEEYDKLLIISSFESNYNDSILDFITTELKTEQNQKIKLYLAKYLNKAKNMDKVVIWLNNNYKVLEDIKDPVAEFYINSNAESFNARIVKVLLAKNIVSVTLIQGKSSLFFDFLYSGLPTNAKDDNIYLKELESEIMRNAKLKEIWLNYKMDKEKGIYTEEFKEKQLKLINEFKQKSASLYDAFKIEGTYKSAYLESIKNFEKEFSKKTGK